MDDWTYLNLDSDPDTDAPSSEPMLLDQVWSAVADNLRASHAQAEANRRAVEFEQARVWNSVHDGRSVLDVPPPFEAPASTSLTY